MTNIEVANYFWHCDKHAKVPLRSRIVRYLDHLFLTGWRYRRHVRTWTKGTR